MLISYVSRSIARAAESIVNKEEREESKLEEDDQAHVQQHRLKLNCTNGNSAAPDPNSTAPNLNSASPNEF